MRMRGFSLIEMMIAILIGSILLLGITSLFSTTSNVNRMENGLARLQENGRFALSRISHDIRMASALRNMRKASEGGGAGRTNPDRPLVSLVDFGGSEIGWPPAPGGVSRYLLSPVFLMRGYECTTGCTPIPGVANVGSDLFGGGIPAVGTLAGTRAAGADMLTLRYLSNVGTALAEDQDPLVAGVQALSGPLAGKSIELDLAPGETYAVGPSGLAVIGDYSTTAIVPVSQADADTLQIDSARLLTGAVLNSGFTADNDSRISDFDSNFLTVTYYLRISDDPSVPGRRTSVLHRRENGRDAAIAEGIERLDFLYHVEDRTGQIRPMTAAQVQAFGGTGLCTPAPANPTLEAAIFAIDSANCGWRSVRAIEVSLLANTVDDAGAPQEPFQYSFLANGAANTANAVEVACDPAYNASCPGGAVTVLPSGLPPGRMLRREFRTVVTVRNNAY